ncbi:MAG: cytosine deaminase [Synechococcales cyanobacterium RM1_1_8]|nr:cytosine deaminase [Synechococcales cyanobacterium RM1_1_8]
MVVDRPVFDSPQYELRQAKVPHCLLVDGDPSWAVDREGLVELDLTICDGRVTRIQPFDREREASLAGPIHDCRGGQVWPCFIDGHTHLDKGHIWPRTPNPDGRFDSALAAVMADAEQYCSPEDVYLRLEFGLRCSYAQGTQAIRTHIDAADRQAEISFGVFGELQRAWRDRLTLQAVCLVSLDYFMTPQGEKLADQMAEVGGILGGVGFNNPQLPAQVQQLFKLAQDRGLDLDLHVDESDDPADTLLPLVAQTAMEMGYSGRLTCDHCCSLAVQSEDQQEKTIALVKAAGIHVISLPMCNLYLQDRQPSNQAHKTPFWRGITLVHELKAAGVPVAFASDNCRDPFFGFGDHDMLEVWRESVRIAHLDQPYGDWPRSVTQTPAALMGLENRGLIGVGLPADLILFQGRGFSELLSRGQGDRIVLRRGKAIDQTLPDYRELDGLLGVGDG